ncbi:MAG TPA: hypothetical protein VFP21_06155 [Solirubrobacterales bacterium]|nr:hypothetical protein [Solirubrobacterales bacterium]
MRRIGSFGRAASALLLVLVAVSASAAPGAAAPPKVLVVGDSLEELTSPHLSRYLPGTELVINAAGGYNSYQIFDLFQESYEPSDDVIVFDAGTNDNPAYPEILAGNLAKVAGIVGNRCMVVPTIHGLHPGGVDDTGKNRVVAEFAASRPGTQVPDWAGVVATHPELMQADNLHPIEEGADYRAQLIAQGVQGCLAYEQARATAPPQPAAGEPRPEVEPIATVGRLQARRAEVMDAIRADVLRQAAASLVMGALLAGR